MKCSFFFKAAGTLFGGCVAKPSTVSDDDIKDGKEKCDDSIDKNCYCKKDDCNKATAAAIKCYVCDTMNCKTEKTCQSGIVNCMNKTTSK